MEYSVVNPPRIYPFRPVYQSIKRLVDLVLCVLILPFAIPLFLLCSVAILLGSGRPIFYIQERIGKGGKPFNIYKFRTLESEDDESQSRTFMKAYIRGEIIQDETTESNYKPELHQRIFPVGNFLRRTSLDELPQLINVLKNEMSIVGPRPNVTWEVDVYHPWHYERLEVLPGITGLAQVNGRSGISFNKLVRYDINYIENQNLDLDLKIIWQTFKSVLLSKGAG
jgi:lipopolysaccharide/colanic/teichoic acid biosynthesis glycosyltransferase